jgi:peptide deformylase
VRIIIAPDPILKAKAEPVRQEELGRLKQASVKMAKLMYKSHGCGLAAPQVGISKRMIVVDAEWSDKGEDGAAEVPKNPTVYVNPVIKKSWGEVQTSDEGCLSVPGISIAIARADHIEVEAQNLDGETFTIEAEGFLARVLQHEIDHLEGVTMFEHLDPIKRIEAFQEYELALAAGAQPGDTSIPDESRR